ncbi:hypothetical protein [Evansella tamaricis]|uniref:Cytochrome c domain-containing protein n=1 Tax=Evansella tamaricis TaxID=2069301 RepID=A0ABS6J9K6_9BACI|nr:hypothetical protein [Evansella tamaricis]MBU9710367.1 hypothetical protein [Evansella tamaricis]
MGKNGELGIPGTLLKGEAPDPYNSLNVLLDSKLRKQVIEANLNREELSTANVSGKGHEFWIDSSTGFTSEERDAVIHYLLRLSDKE